MDTKIWIYFRTLFENSKYLEFHVMGVSGFDFVYVCELTFPIMILQWKQKICHFKFLN